MSVGPLGPDGVLQNFERSLFWDPLSAKAKESKNPIQLRVWRKGRKQIYLKKYQKSGAEEE